ncbi:MAG: beta-barrel fold lipoprotein [Tissierella sp.]|uniref:beta-barrel fold lipoprotein n=1 Tax=Tissierella sp. TaxID=41274 RepID=UPI003F952395
MKKFTILSFILVFISIIMLGCQLQDSKDSNKINLKDEIKEINIFQSNEFKNENSDLIVSASDTDNTEIFETVKTIISDSIKQAGIVDMIEPNYNLEIVYEDDSTKELYLWLMEVEDGKGSLMEAEDTHIVYSFSEDLNAKLIDLIKSK